MKLLVILIDASVVASSVGRAAPCPLAFESKTTAPLVGPKVVVISAPSGGGKTTLAAMLVKEFPNLKLSISSTTRPPRGQEKNGVDYHFLSKEEFQRKIKAGEFAEWAEVHGNYYGTDLRALQKSLSEGNSVLALLDVNGADSLRKSLPQDVYTVFISPPDMKTLEARLRGRGTDSEDAIQKRLKNAKEEIAAAPRFDKIVVNDDLQKAYGELVSALRAQKLISQAPVAAKAGVTE